MERLARWRTRLSRNPVRAYQDGPGATHSSVRRGDVSAPPVRFLPRAPTSPSACRTGVEPWPRSSRGERLVVDRVAAGSISAGVARCSLPCLFGGYVPDTDCAGERHPCEVLRKAVSVGRTLVQVSGLGQGEWRWGPVPVRRLARVITRAVDEHQTFSQSVPPVDDCRRDAPRSRAELLKARRQISQNSVPTSWSCPGAALDLWCWR